MDFVPVADDRRKLCSLYLAQLDRMGIGLRVFGDATERQAGI